MADPGDYVCACLYLGRVDHHMVYDAFLRNSLKGASLFSDFFCRFVFPYYYLLNIICSFYSLDIVIYFVLLCQILKWEYVRRNKTASRTGGFKGESL